MPYIYIDTLQLFLSAHSISDNSGLWIPILFLAGRLPTLRKANTQSLDHKYQWLNISFMHGTFENMAFV